jgi:glycosyltransferase involved in cell wall biosynthesis
MLQRMPEPAARISVVIPALNEQDAIGRVVAAMPWQQIAECIVVDNGSTDDTAAVARAAGARVITSPRGYGAACFAGAAAALPTSDILVFLDGDGSDDPADFDRMTQPVLDGTEDFTIGSRLKHADPGSLMGSQIFAAHFVGLLMRVFLQARYTDMGPFRVMRREALQSLDMQERTFGWNLEMQIKAVQRGLRVREIPVHWRNRIAGESKVSGDLRASCKTAARIVEVFVRVGLLRRR